MAPGIAYDDSGSLASYFGVTVLAFILIPSTYYTLLPSKRNAPKPLAPYPAHIQQTHPSAKTSRSGSSKLKRVALLALGYAVLAFFCFRIINAPPSTGGTVYNPFEILGLSDRSTEKQIKKHYKKLSLQFHPDKIKLSENQTKEDAEAKFVDLTKAYKALTDEVTRENLAKYGNPDGPQQREDKIAIPQWVVEGKNNIWVLGAYGLVLGGGIPFVVGRWWFAQRSLTRDGVLNPTAELFFHYLREDTDFLSLISLLASAVELATILGGKRPGSKKERKERQARIEELDNELDALRTELDVDEDVVMRKENKIGVHTAAARRAQALLWAHMLRYDLKDKELRDEQAAVLRKTPVLLNAMLNICLSHNWLKTTLAIVKLQAALAQALPPTASPLAQFPGVSHEDALELEVVKGAEGKKWAEKAVKKGLLEGDAKVVAEHWPRLEITDAEFKVTGERIVTPGSIVNLTFQARYVFPTTAVSAPVATAKAIPNGVAHDEEKPKANGSVDSVADVEEAVVKAENVAADVKEKVVDAVEEKVEAVLDSEKKEPKIGRKGKKPAKDDRIWPSNGYAYAPRWPGLRKAHFQVLMGDSKLDKVIVQPTKISDLPLPRPDGLASEPREYSLQFQAPPQANMYSFVLYAASDTFLGSDVSRPMMLLVEDPPADADYESDDDISEPDEDSLAGQMAMMRGGKVKPSDVHGRRDESDDESGSEDEYESSSDEEEGPKGRRAGKAINVDSSDEE